MIKVIWIPARHIMPVHHIQRLHHFHELVARMRRSGWVGRPLLVESLAQSRYSLKPSGHYQGWTGTHRLAAARALGMRVPVILVNKGRASRLPLLLKTVSDPDRYRLLRQRRDPAAFVMLAEMRINAVADRAGAL